MTEAELQQLLDNIYRCLHTAKMYIKNKQWDMAKMMLDAARGQHNIIKASRPPRPPPPPPPPAPVPKAPTGPLQPVAGPSAPPLPKNPVDIQAKQIESGYRLNKKPKLNLRLDPLFVLQMREFLMDLAVAKYASPRVQLEYKIEKDASVLYWSDALFHDFTLPDDYYRQRAREMNQVI